MQKNTHTHTHTYKHTHTHTHAHILFWHLQQTAQSFKWLDTGSTQTLPLWNIHRRLINTWWQRASSHFEFWPNRFLKCFFILFFSLHFLSETFRECLRTLVTVATDQDEIAMRKSWVEDDSFGCATWPIQMCDMSRGLYLETMWIRARHHTHTLSACARVHVHSACAYAHEIYQISNAAKRSAKTTNNIKTQFVWVCTCACTYTQNGTCVHTCTLHTYVYIHVRIHAHTYTHTHTHTHTHTLLCIYACICICIHYV